MTLQTQTEPFAINLFSTFLEEQLPGFYNKFVEENIENICLDLFKQIPLFQSSFSTSNIDKSSLEEFVFSSNPNATENIEITGCTLKGRLSRFSAGRPHANLELVKEKERLLEAAKNYLFPDFSKEDELKITVLKSESNQYASIETEWPTGFLKFNEHQSQWRVSHLNRQWSDDKPLWSKVADYAKTKSKEITGFPPSRAKQNGEVSFSINLCHKFFPKKMRILADLMPRFLCPNFFALDCKPAENNVDCNLKTPSIDIETKVYEDRFETFFKMNSPSEEVISCKGDAQEYSCETSVAIS